MSERGATLATARQAGEAGPRAGAPDLPPRFDAQDPEVVADPYPRYAELRRAGPLARGGPGTWLVTRHADVTRLLGDPRLGNELPAVYHQASLGDGPASQFFARILFYRDAPVHTRLRRLMAAGFTPRLVGALRERIGLRVDALLARALDTGRFDAIHDLADPLSFEVICLLLGIPPADRDEVRPRAAELAGGFTYGRSAQERLATDEAAVWLSDYLADLLAQRRRRPGADLLSRMLTAEAGEDSLLREEVVDNCVFLFWAGFETVLSLIGTTCSALAAHPAQFRRLRADPALVPTAIEELLRYDAPIQGTSRLVGEEVEIGGRRIRPGRLLVLLLGSANHDERAFTRPQQLDVGRHPNPHVSFGGGPHRCLGNVLARAEGAVVLERLIRRFSALEPAAPAVRRTTMTWMRFHASVPIAATPAGRSGAAARALRGAAPGAAGGGTRGR